MITVSDDFKLAMKQPVKELQAYITGDVGIKSEDDLISFKISCDSGLCKTAMRKLEAKYIGEHNLLGQWVHAGFGVKLADGTFEYLDYGSFLVTEMTTTKDTGITTIAGYDKMINAMTTYQPLNVEYPIRLIDYTNILCEACNLELAGNIFGKNRVPNFDSGKWILSNGAFINADGNLEFPNDDSKAVIEIEWGTNINTIGVQYTIVTGGNSHLSLTYMDENKQKLDTNGRAVRDKEDNYLLTASFGGDNEYGEAISKAKYVRITIQRSTSAPNPFVIKNVSCDTYINDTKDCYTLYNDMNNWLIDRELWENIEGITYRDIFVQIAQATGTTCIITNDDKVYFKPLTDTSESLTYDNMFKLKLEAMYGEINSVVLSRTPQEDNIYMRDEESIQANGLTEFKIENNEIIDKDRDSAMTPIYEALKGISYYPFETTTEGLGWYEVGDNFNIINDNGDVFNTSLFNFSITIDGSIKETLKTVAESKTQTQYQYASTIAKRIKNTEIITNKQEQYIQQLVSDMYSENGVVNENFTKVYQDITNIINSVQNSGGSNLLKNSVMFAYDNDNNPTDWEISHGGKNLADIKMEQGAYGFSDGVKYEYSNYIRTAEKIPVVAGETYTLSFKGYQPTSWDSGFIFFKDGVYHSCLAQQSLTFTVPEGVNQVAYDLCKSDGIAPTDVWDIQLEKGAVATEYEPHIESTLIMDSNVESMSVGALSGHSFTLLEKIARQKVFVSTETYYTFSTKIKKNLTGSCYVKLYNSNEEHIIELKAGEEAFYKDYEIAKLLPKDNYYIVEFYGSVDSEATFTDNMLAIGEYKSQWTQANGEIMNTQVNVNLNGVLVKSSVYLGDYTVMSPLEFAGYSKVNGTITRVFSLNKDVTEVEKLLARKQIKMVPIKVVPVTSGELQGWAFVESL